MTLAEFRARAIDIAGPGLHHKETSKFDIDRTFKVNLKILSMLRGDLVGNFRTLPRGAQYEHWFSR